MPRPTRTATRPEPAPGPNSFVASAARVVGRKNQPRSNQAQAWQAEAWEMFDQVGELAASAMWVSNALSRVNLVVKQQTTQGRVAVDGGEPVAVLESLYDGPTGQSQMMAAWGIYFTVPGEGWLVGVPADAEKGRLKDWWRVLSNQEVKRVGDRWEIERGDGVVERYKATTDDRGAAEAFVLRIWRSHPARWVEATSPVRAALPILRELVGLTKHVAANIDSRLAGAGILAVPQEMTFSSPPSDDEPTGEPEADEFLAALIEAMVTPIADRGSAAAVVPLVIKAPGSILGNIQHIKFSSDLDAEARELRNESIRRLALALDIPPEVLLGVSDVNHWSAWLITEEAIRIHIEPLVELITSALTTEYLWPALIEGGVQDPTSYVIEGDTSELRVQQSHEASAQTLHADLRITDEALLRETGLETSDLLLPNTEEYRRRVLERLVLAGTPEFAVLALRALGVDVPDPGASEGEPPALGGPTPPVTPVIEAPRTPPSMAAAGNEQAAALIVAAELLSVRAMERAKNRLNGRRKGPLAAQPPEALDSALVDAWSHVPRAAALCGVGPADLQRACDGYVRQQLRNGEDHNPMVLVEHLQPLIDGVSDAA